MDLEGFYGIFLGFRKSGLSQKISNDFIQNSNGVHGTPLIFMDLSILKSFKIYKAISDFCFVLVDVFLKKTFGTNVYSNTCT